MGALERDFRWRGGVRGAGNTIVWGCGGKWRGGPFPGVFRAIPGHRSRASRNRRQPDAKKPVAYTSTTGLLGAIIAGWG